MPTRIERSELSTPASNWSMIEKAVKSAADVVMLDLEDSVAPNEKAASRANVIRAVNELDWGAKPRVFRLNALDTPYFYRDIVDVVEGCGANLDLIVAPKIDRPDQVATLDTLLSSLEAALGLERRIGLEIQIESAIGLLNAERSARASARLEAIIFGPGDYAASVGMPAASIGSFDEWDAAYGAHRWHHVMHQILIAGRAAGLRVMDGPFANFRDLDGFRRACLVARALGYDGKWCIHPAQIAIANEVFSPTAAEVAWASQVVEAYAAAMAAGRGAISVDQKMVDAASIKLAESTLARASAAGMR